VLVAVQINVARSQEEADRQARGENVTVIKDEKLDIETYSEDLFEEGAAPKDEDEAEEA
jgi:large subunit ribosomal protein L9